MKNKLFLYSLILIILNNKEDNKIIKIHFNSNTIVKKFYQTLRNLIKIRNQKTLTNILTPRKLIKIKIQKIQINTPQRYIY